MNKIEHAALKGVRNSLHQVRTHKSGDDWEAYGNRMKERIQSALEILENLLELPLEENKEDNNEPLTLD